MGSPLGFRSILGRGRIEFALEVPVAEPVDGEVAGQHRGEQVGRVRVDRVEGGDAGACCRARSAQRVEFDGGLTGQRQVIRSGATWAPCNGRDSPLCNSFPGIDMSAEVSCSLGFPEGAGKVDTTEANGMP